MKSQNNSFSMLIHEVSLGEVTVLLWRAISANRIGRPVNFWGLAFSPICWKNSNIVCATTVRFSAKCYTLLKECYCERRGRTEAVTSLFIGSEPVRTLLVGNVKNIKNSHTTDDLKESVHNTVF